MERSCSPSKMVEYNHGYGKLYVIGRAAPGSYYSIIDASNGEILTDRIWVREGEFVTEIKDDKLAKSRYEDPR